MTDSLISFSNEIADLVERTAASVVAVHGRRRFNSSGVHWSPGVIVTADHTLRADEGIVITTGSGEEFAAEIAGRDPGTDLAVLRVAGLDPNSVVPAAARNGAATYRPGDLAVAVGRNQQSANASLGVIASLFWSIRYLAREGSRPGDPARSLAASGCIRQRRCQCRRSAHWNGDAGAFPRFRVCCSGRDH